MKNLKVIIPIIVIVLLVGGTVWQTLGNKSASAPVSQQQSEQVQPKGTGVETVITYTDQGYSPSSVTIKKGDTVVWKNESAKDFWPASAMHPTHTLYPGSNIEKCNTAAQSSIFDACSPHAPGTSWSFTFFEQGSWKFHDHLFPSRFGTITVE